MRYSSDSWLNDKKRDSELITDDKIKVTTEAIQNYVRKAFDQWDEDVVRNIKVVITGSDIVILLTVIFRYMDSDSDILSQVLIYRISQILRDLGMIFLVVTTHNISYALVLESQSNHEIVEEK